MTLFQKYEEVRKSGVTNMFDIKKVIQITGLTKEEIVNIMENYDDLKIQNEMSLCCSARITDDGFCSDCKEHATSEQELWEKRNKGNVEPIMQDILDSICHPMY